MILIAILIMLKNRLKEAPWTISTKETFRICAVPLISKLQLPSLSLIHDAASPPGACRVWALFRSQCYRSRPKRYFYVIGII